MPPSSISSRAFSICAVAKPLTASLRAARRTLARQMRPYGAALRAAAAEWKCRTRPQLRHLTVFPVLAVIPGPFPDLN